MLDDHTHTIPANHPHFVDVAIGRRAREARLSHGLTQTELGNAIGVSFQQIQKYEKGTNRISGSRLWMIGNVLNVPVVYFFQGLDGDAIAEEVAAGANLPERTIRVAKLLNELPDGGIKERVFDLIKAFAKVS